MNELIEKLKNDEGFKALISKYEAPNCFDVMGNTRREEWHSNFVWWLLDPKSNHGLGTYPICKLFELMASKNECGRYGLAKKETFQDFNFIPEKTIKNGRNDIFAENENYVLIIENKLDANETYNVQQSKPQTQVYYEYFNDDERYRDKEKFYIYLCPLYNKKKPADSNFKVLTYQELYEGVILKCVEEYKDISPKTEMVINQYIDAVSGPLQTLNRSYRPKIKILNVNENVSEKIYNRNDDLFKLLNEKIDGKLRDMCEDADKDIWVFYDEYKGYINEIILNNMGKRSIIQRRRDVPVGKELLRALVEDGYVTCGETDLIAKRKSNEITYIIQIFDVEGEYKCQIGYLKDEEYFGQDVEPLVEIDRETGERKAKLFDAISTAATEAEKEAYSKHSITIPKGAGCIPSDFTISGSRDVNAEGKNCNDLYKRD